MPDTLTTSPENWHGHPLYDLLDKPRPVDFSVKFELYVRSTKQFVPLFNAQTGVGVAVTAKLKTVSEPALSIPSGTTDAAGQLPAFSASVPPSATLTFACHVAGLAPAGELLQFDIETDTAPMFDAAISGTFVRTYRLRERIYPQYETFWNHVRASDEESVIANWLGGIGALVTADNRLVRTLREFETSYQDSDFNVLYEGDSWLHYPPNEKGNQDLYCSLDAQIRARYAPPEPSESKYRHVALQHFGDTSTQMFGLNPGPGAELPEHTQFFYTKKCLDTYRFNVIILSSGGNDFGEPGISTPAPGKQHAVAAYSPYFLKDEGVLSAHEFDHLYYEPYLAAMIAQPPPEPGGKLPGMAQYWLERSFSGMLKNHRWHLFLEGRPDPDTNPSEQMSEATLNTIFDTQISLLFQEANRPLPDAAMLGKLRNDLPTALQEALALFPDPSVSDPATRRVDFPDCIINSPANDLLDAVFDRARFRSRFDETGANLERFFDRVKQTQDLNKLLVLGHTYCYAMFTDKQTTFFGRHKGPWFHNRFRQARITNLFVQSVSIRYMIDFYKWQILDPLVQKYAPFFDYVDGRDLNHNPLLWNDEIHLEAAGFKDVAARMIAKITAKFAQDFPQ